MSSEQGDTLVVGCNRKKRRTMMRTPWEAKKRFEDGSTAIWNRFTKAPSNAESFRPNEQRALDYAIAVIERQIAKAAGVLTFGGVLLAGLALSDGKSVPKISAILACAVSSTLALFISYVNVDAHLVS